MHYFIIARQHRNWKNHYNFLNFHTLSAYNSNYQKILSTCAVTPATGPWSAHHYLTTADVWLIGAQLIDKKKWYQKLKEWLEA